MSWVVVDTSYLLELFRVPACFEESAHATIVDKFQAQVATGGRIYVPIPVIFELANHIADIRDGSLRLQFAQRLKDTIETSLELQSPWIITPIKAERVLWDLTASLLELSGSFAEEYAIQAIGLTDAAVIDYARKLKSSHASLTLGQTIHIWTRDQSLKAHEPDTESDAFL